MTTRSACGGGCVSKQPTLRWVLAEGIEALAAELQQRVALAIAQLYCCAEAFGYAANQAVVAIAVGGAAVGSEHAAHHALPRIRWATSCAWAGLAVAWQIRGPGAP